MDIRKDTQTPRPSHLFYCQLQYIYYINNICHHHCFLKWRTFREGETNEGKTSERSKRPNGPDRFYVF